MYPYGIKVSPDGTRAYVANTGPDTGPGGSSVVSVVDTSTDKVIGSITVGQAPQVLAISPDGRLLYVSCHDGVVVIDAPGRRVRTAHRHLTNPHGIAITPDSRHAWVAHSPRDEVVVFNTANDREAGRIRVGEMPWNQRRADGDRDRGRSRPRCHGRGAPGTRG